MALHTVEDALLLLWYPARFGGLPISLPFDYLYRGGADPGSKELASIYRLAEHNLVARRIYNDILSERTFSPSADARTLLTDPYSLPVIRPANVKMRVDSMITSYITSFNKNGDIKQLHTDAVTAHSDKIISDLFAVRPLNPLVISEIYSNSIPSEVEKFERMFINVRTIQGMARRSGINTAPILLEASGRELSSIVEIVRASPRRTSFAVHSALDLFNTMNKWRSLWGHIINPSNPGEVQISGVTSICPIAIAYSRSSEPTPASGVKLCAYSSDVSFSERGPYTPYLGTATKAHRSTHGYKIIKRSRPAIAVNSLALLYSHPSIGPNLKYLISQIALTRSPIDISKESIGGKYIGGSVQHRLVASMRSPGCYVVSYSNLTSWAFFVSDECEGISASAKDYSMMFQEFYCYLVSILGNLLKRGEISDTYVELLIPCSNTTIPELDEGHCDMPFVQEVLDDMWTVTSPMLVEESKWFRTLKGPILSKKLTVFREASELNPGEVRDFSLLATILNHISPIRDLDFYTARKRKGLRKLPIDLPTLVRIGDQKLIETACYAICLSSLNKHFADLSGLTIDDNIAHYVYRLCVVWSDVLLMSLTERNMPRGYWTTQCEISATFKPTSYAERPGARLCNLMFRTCLKCLRGKTNPFLRRIFFADEASGMGRVSLIGAFMWTLCRYTNTNSLFPYRVATLSLLNSSSGNVSPHESVNVKRIYAFFRSLTMKNSLPTTIKEELVKVVQRLTFFSVDAGSDECIRWWRELLPKPSGEAPMTKNRIFDEIQAPYLAEKTIRALPRQRVVGNNILRRLTAAAQTVTPGHGLLFNLYFEFFKSVQCDQLLVVGVGRGVLIEAYLDSNDGDVVGLDLADMYDLQSLRRGEKPVAIAAHPRRHKYSWSPLTYHKFANLCEEIDIFAESITLTGNSFFFFDIQPFQSEQDWMEAALRVSEKRAFLYLKKYSMTQANKLILEDLNTYPIEPQIMRESGIELLVVYMVTRKRLGPHPPASINAVHRLIESKCTPMKSYVPADTGVLLAILNKRLTYMISSTVDKTDLVKVEKALRYLVGRRQASDNYSDWTETLAHLWASQWVLFDNCDMETLLEILECKRATIQLSESRTIQVKMSDYMRDLINLHALTFAPLWQYFVSLHTQEENI